MSLSHIQHGLDEVLTIQIEYARYTDNKLLLQNWVDCQLAFQLC